MITAPASMPPAYDSGDTAWMLAAAAMVLLMTPPSRSSTAAWSAPSTSW
ncbi:hypothetical protein NKH77_51440 [Streptomyces sp. M19]